MKIVNGVIMFVCVVVYLGIMLGSTVNYISTGNAYVDMEQANFCHFMFLGLPVVFAYAFFNTFFNGD